MSRRSRAVRKGVIQANRHERHRQARQDLPPNVTVILLLAVAVVVVGAMLVAALNKNETPTSPTTTGTSAVAGDSELTVANCVRIRRDWNSVVDTDFDQAQDIQADYRSIGCYGLCGDLVEDTDTPEAETRCEYP